MGFGGTEHDHSHLPFSTLLLQCFFVKIKIYLFDICFVPLRKQSLTSWQGGIFDIVVEKHVAVVSNNSCSVSCTEKEAEISDTQTVFMTRNLQIMWARSGKNFCSMLTEPLSPPIFRWLALRALLRLHPVLFKWYPFTSKSRRNLHEFQSKLTV